MKKENQPSFSQVAVVMKKFFSEKGFDIALNFVQQALARAHGYASFNAMVAEMPYRKAPQPELAESELSAFEGYEYWNVTGRVPYDDDDTSELIWVAPGETPAALFKLLLAEEACVDIQDATALEAFEIILCTETKIGQVKAGVFVLEASQLPSGVAAPF